MESVNTLNQRLIDHYGLDSNTGRAMFRIVWANDQTEKRLVSHTDSGIEFLYPTVVDAKKYAYMKDLWVLERLVIVPDMNKQELLEMKLSYEPIWAYCAYSGEERTPLPPHWGATKMIIDALYAALGKKSLAKYIEDEKNTTKEGKEQRITELQAELFGDDTETSDALHYKEGIVVPKNYKKES